MMRYKNSCLGNTHLCAVCQEKPMPGEIHAVTERFREAREKGRKGGTLRGGEAPTRAAESWWRQEKKLRKRWVLPKWWTNITSEGNCSWRNACTERAAACFNPRGSHTPFAELLLLCSEELVHSNFNQLLSEVFWNELNTSIKFSCCDYKVGGDGC